MFNESGEIRIEFAWLDVCSYLLTGGIAGAKGLRRPRFP